MNVCSFFKDKILSLFQDSLPSSKLFDRIVVEPAKDSSHGDLASNVALVLAKSFKQSPRAFAEGLIPKLESDPQIAKAEVAGPGFINLFLKNDFWYEQLKTVLTQESNYGSSTLGKGTKVNIEFVSANPTGPLHAGHGRGAVLGDVLASLLQKAGYDVCREYYVNDAGGQIQALVRSVYLRYQEALGRSISMDQFSEDMYGGDYIIPLAHHLVEIHKDFWLDKPESEWLPVFEEKVLHILLGNIQEDLRQLGVHFDLFTSEKAIIQKGLVEETLRKLEAQGNVYVGVLDAPKGHQVEDWEERPQTLFKSTDYGDDVDRALKKSDGTWTYFAGDIAYHYDKLSRGFDLLIDVLGADHGGYIKRIEAAVKALSSEKVPLEVKISQMVNFMDQGQPVRMSKRAGTFVTLKDVVERVGKDATRYMMVSRHQDMKIDFDFQKVLDQHKDNPVFYVQYAHARICSVLRHAVSLFSDIDHNSLESAPIHLLTAPDELAMIKRMTDWPRQIELAALTKEPHRLALFLYDLASGFHGLWAKGRENMHLRFIDPSSREKTLAHIALLKGIQFVLRSGFEILGMAPVEEM